MADNKNNMDKALEALTGALEIIDGATCSIKRLPLFTIGPKSSKGLPKGSTIRPNKAEPEGTLINIYFLITI